MRLVGRPRRSAALGLEGCRQGSGRADVVRLGAVGAATADVVATTALAGLAAAVVKDGAAEAVAPTVHARESGLRSLNLQILACVEIKCQGSREIF